MLMAQCKHYMSDILCQNAMTFGVWTQTFKRIHFNNLHSLSSQSSRPFYSFYPTFFSLGASSVSRASSGFMLCQQGYFYQGGPAPWCSGLLAPWGVHIHTKGAPQPSSSEQHGGDPAGHQRRPWQGGKAGPEIILMRRLGEQKCVLDNL